MTPTQSTAEQLEVTQADREAAASTQDHFPLTAKVIRAGKHDHTQLVQAFARHRQATEAHIAAAVEAERERCADLADNHSFALDIDDWMKMTKKEISAYACRSVAAAIRSQSNG